MTLAFFLMTVAACCVLYLTHRNQGWLARPLAATPWRMAGAFGLLMALALGLREFSTVTATFAWLASAMLTFSLLPFGTLLLSNKDRA